MYFFFPDSDEVILEKKRINFEISLSWEPTFSLLSDGAAMNYFLFKSRLVSLSNTSALVRNPLFFLFTIYSYTILFQFHIFLHNFFRIFLFRIWIGKDDWGGLWIRVREVHNIEWYQVYMATEYGPEKYINIHLW